MMGSVAAWRMLSPPLFSSEETYSVVVVVITVVFVTAKKKRTNIGCMIDVVRIIIAFLEKLGALIGRKEYELQKLPIR